MLVMLPSWALLLSLRWLVSFPSCDSVSCHFPRQPCVFEIWHCNLKIDQTIDQVLFLCSLSFWRWELHRLRCVCGGVFFFLWLIDYSVCFPITVDFHITLLCPSLSLLAYQFFMSIHTFPPEFSISLDSETSYKMILTSISVPFSFNVHLKRR